jgi:hypothetical protein
MQLDLADLPLIAAAGDLWLHGVQCSSAVSERETFGRDFSLVNDLLSVLIIRELLRAVVRFIRKRELDIVEKRWPIPIGTIER